MKEQVFDPVRRKRVVLTPEEDVRQQLIGYLSNNLGYPLSRMVCEYSVVINGLKYRGDLVILDKELKPFFLAECKASSVKISRATFEQILRYNSALNVRCLLLTNGHTTYFALKDLQSDNYDYHTEIPSYNELFK
ncbi:MAG: type I restriction enzyme HsdR N-terminal domain-containing protein [Rikenellaceae bacterium]|nr:type I restriction enzyme HsdR N-terminal domain-containing protein [Rikenellaceae bacterium]